MLRPLRQTPAEKAFFRKCYDFRRAAEVRAAGLYPYGTTLDRDELRGNGTTLRLDGRPILMFGSNDYLGLTQDARVKEAAAEALRTFGSGCSGSRMLNGTLSIHRQLEEELAAFMNREDVVLFSTGYQANHGCLTALSQRGDVIVMDRDNHASLVDGCLAGLGRMVRFKHGDMEDLRSVVREGRAGGNYLLVMDGVFSMQGDIVDLPEVSKVARECGGGVFLDEAHSIGVLGDHGRGVGEYFGLEDEIDVVTGTFSKSLAAVGGFIACTAEIADFVRHNCRSYIFSASLPPAPVGAVREALRIVAAEPERRARVMDLGRRIRQGLLDLGFEVPPGDAPIIPVVVSDEITVMKAFHRLLAEGVYVNPVLPPASSKPLLRISCMATHQERDLDQLFEVMEKVGREMSLFAPRAEATPMEE